MAEKEPIKLVEIIFRATTENWESVNLLALRLGLPRQTVINYAIYALRTIEDIHSAGGRILTERSDGKVFELEFQPPNPHLMPDDLPNPNP